jgi:predicted nuclease with RNAse H fold
MHSLGVDVGLRKGLDAVLLDGDRRVVALHRHVPHGSFRELVLSLEPDVVAIDSPPRWATPLGARQTEREMRRLGIHLYATPVEERRSVKGFHDWMIAGMDAFRAIEDRYPLFSGGAVERTALEVFPHSTAVVLSRGLMPAGATKHRWRKSALMRAGVVDERIATPDVIDAALAALTGLLAIEGLCCWLGVPEEGMIVLPCQEADLPARYSRLPL